MSHQLCCQAICTVVTLQNSDDQFTCLLWNDPLPALDMLHSGWYRGTVGRITSNGRTFSIDPTNRCTCSPVMRHSLPQKVTVSQVHWFAAWYCCCNARPQLAFHMLFLQIDTLQLLLHFNLSPQVHNQYSNILGRKSPVLAVEVVEHLPWDWSAPQLKFFCYKKVNCSSATSIWQWKISAAAHSQLASQKLAWYLSCHLWI